jgi:hypothetical protein
MFFFVQKVKVVKVWQSENLVKSFVWVLSLGYRDGRKKVLIIKLKVHLRVRFCSAITPGFFVL